MHAAATLRQPLARCGKRGKHLSQHGFVLPSDAYTFQAILCRHGRARQRCVGRMSGGELLWFRGRAAGGALQRRRWTVAFRVRRHATHSPARQVTRSVKATPSYSAPRPAGNREVAAARPPAKAPQPAPPAALRHALRLAPHRGRGDADCSTTSCGSCSKTPRLRDEVDAALREAGKKAHGHHRASASGIDGNWKHLAGARVQPYTCKIGERWLEITAELRISGAAGEHYSTVSDIAAQNATNDRRDQPALDLDHHQAARLVSGVRGSTARPTCRRRRRARRR